MSAFMSQLFRTDNTTVILGVSLAVAYLLKSYLTPESLVHPILLGRQSDVERVRQKGESAQYRNYGTGMIGQLPVRPAGEVKTLLDLAKLDTVRDRTLWSSKISNGDLKARVSALGTGFVREANLSPKESNVLMLLNDGLDFIVTDLALASQCITSMTISSLTLLSAVLELHTPTTIIVHIEFLPQLLELLAETLETVYPTLIVVGEGDLPDVVIKSPAKVLWLADLERKGRRGGAVQVSTPEPDTIFSISFFPGPNNELKAVSLTHMNLTAGVAAVRVQLPMNGSISEKDNIVSSHSLATPYGRAIAYTAMYEGASFATSDSTAIFVNDDVPRSPGDDLVKDIGSPNPTILFLTNPELSLLSSSILSKAKESLFFGIAWRHKLFALQHGHLSNDSAWDNQAFASARLAILKQASKTLRAVIAAGGSPIEAEGMSPTRIALSLPVVFAYIHPTVAGPVFSSHPLDFQSFAPKQSRSGHVGPPAVNIEVKLVGIDDAAVETGADPIGEILVRGPSVALPLGSETPYTWLPLEDRAVAQTNGTFKIIS